MFIVNTINYKPTHKVRLGFILIGFNDLNVHTLKVFVDITNKN